MSLQRITLSAAARATRNNGQRRAMGGGNFPYSFGVRKNKFVEEWNGRREMTERAFYVDAKKVPPLLFYCVAFPYFLYSISSAELKHYQGENGREVA